MLLYSILFSILSLPLFSRVLSAEEAALVGEQVAEQTSTTSVDFTWMFLKMIFAMIFVIAFAFVVVRYLLPKLSFTKFKGQSSAVRVIDRIPLDQRKFLAVISTQNKQFLIGVSDHYIGLISELEKDYAEKN